MKGTIFCINYHYLWWIIETSFIEDIFLKRINQLLYSGYVLRCNWCFGIFIKDTFSNTTHIISLTKVVRNNLWIAKNTGQSITGVELQMLWMQISWIIINSWYNKSGKRIEGEKGDKGMGLWNFISTHSGILECFLCDIPYS